MYRGLPIITNQIPVEERNGIPHHLISCVDLESEPWRIGIFKEKCLAVIRDIHLRGKLPILVGGTHYYTQAILFEDQLVGENEQQQQLHDDAADNRWAVLDAPTPVVLQKLKQVDPVMADRWHPNESRKIRRSLEIYLQTGKPASTVYAEQSTGQLRFRSLVLWVHTDKETLNSRLDDRVDSMMEHGLMPEAEKMLRHVRERQSHGITFDETRGVWISIGFKELKPYLTARSADNRSQEEELDRLKRSCVESIKIATRQYATSQVKWIRGKFCRELAESNMMKCLYLLDSSDVAAWKDRITEPSESLVQSFLSNEPCSDPKLLSDSARNILGAKEAQLSTVSSDLPKCIACDICHKTMTDQEQWKIHINGRAHKRAIKSKARKRDRDKYLYGRCTEASNAEIEQGHQRGVA